MKPFTSLNIFINNAKTLVNKTLQETVKEAKHHSLDPILFIKELIDFLIALNFDAYKKAPQKDYCHQFYYFLPSWDETALKEQMEIFAKTYTSKRSTIIHDVFSITIYQTIKHLCFNIGDLYFDVKKLSEFFYPCALQTLIREWAHTFINPLPFLNVPSKQLSFTDAKPQSNNLSRDLWQEIIQYLDIKSMKNLQRTCKQFYLFNPVHYADYFYFALGKPISFIKPVTTEKLEQGKAVFLTHQAGLLKSADEISKEELIDSFIQREYQNRLFPSLYQALEYLHFNQCIHGADVLFPIFLVYYNETLDWEDHGDIFAFKNKADGSLDDNIRESHYFTMKAPDPNNITPITGALVFGENHFAEYHQLSPIVMLSDFKIPTKKIRSIS